MNRPAIVRNAYAAWSRGDLDAALVHFRDDVVWQMAGVFPGIEPVYHGHEGVRRFSAAFREPWAKITVDVVSLEEIDAARILATVRFRGEGRGSGVTTTVEFPQIWTFEGDEVAHFQSFADREAALAASKFSRPAPG